MKRRLHLELSSVARENGQVGTWLRELRMAHGMTLAELERRTGIGQSNISRLESGRIDPKLSTLIRLLRGLDRRLHLGF